MNITMWSGHSCPLHLIFVLKFKLTIFVRRREPCTACLLSCFGGQECPLHINTPSSSAVGLRLASARLRAGRLLPKGRELFPPAPILRAWPEYIPFPSRLC